MEPPFLFSFVKDWGCRHNYNVLSYLFSDWKETIKIIVLGPKKSINWCLTYMGRV